MCPSKAFDGAMEKQGRRPERSRVLAVAASIFLFWLTVSLIPVYNKFFFSKKYYPFPIATAGIQLGCVSASLAIILYLQRYLRGRRFDSDGREESWIFGPHLLWKFKAVFPVGFLFGIKYGVTNLGLHLVPAPTHLLLQATDLIWATLGAYFINGERPSPLGGLCLAGCVAGSFVLTVQVGQDLSAPALAIAVNLLSPILLGIVVAALRAACVELMDERNRVGGTVSSAELTAVKLFISSAVALVLAIALEGGEGWKGDGDPDESYSWFGAFRRLAPSVRAGVLGGSVLILIFQVNCTYLTHLTSTVAVGLVAQLKIIPQWAVATMFSFTVHHFNPTGLNFIGAALTMVSAAVYAVNEYLSHSGKGCRVGGGLSDTDDDASGEESEAPAQLGFVPLDAAPSYGSVSDAETGQATKLQV